MSSSSEAHLPSDPGAPDPAVFHLALRVGNTAVVQECLDRGADLASRFQGSTPLHVAAECAPDLAELLLGAGADPEAPDDNGLTAAVRVVRSDADPADQLKALGILRKYGASFDADTVEHLQRIQKIELHRALYELKSGAEVQRQLNHNLDAFVANMLELGTDEEAAADKHPRKSRGRRPAKQLAADDPESILQECCAARDEDRLRTDTFQLNIEGKVTMMYSTPEEKAGHRYARTWMELGQWERARRFLEKVVERDGGDVLAAQLLAWILAACPEDRLRDGARALQMARELARTCLTVVIAWKNEGSRARWWVPGAPVALAAALAERGQLRRALEILNDLEPDKFQPVYRELVERMRACFQTGKPFRDAPLSPELAERGRILAAAYPHDGPDTPEFVIEAGCLKLQRKGLGTAGIRRLLAEPRLRAVASLTISFSGLGAEEVLLLAKELEAPELAHLDLSNNAIPDEAGAVLVAVTRWPKLRDIDLENNKLGLETAKAIAANSALGGLRKLNLSKNELHWSGVAALAASPHPGGLKELYLNDTWITDDGLSGLIASLKRLQVLEARGNWVSVRDLQALVRSPVVAGLRKLDLGWNRLGDGEARALAAAPKGRLVELRLWHNQIRSLGVAALAGSPWLGSVRLLDLSKNPFGPKGFLALANSPYLANLRHLDITGCRIRTESATVLAESVSWKQLREVRVSRDCISAKGRTILRERFGPGLQCR